MPTPEPMSLDDIDQVIADYGLAAERCLSAASMLSSFTVRQVIFRASFLPRAVITEVMNTVVVKQPAALIERVLDALDTAIGIGRVGLRISPGNPYNDHVDANPK